MEQVYRPAKPYRIISWLAIVFMIGYSIYMSSLGWGKESLVSNAVPLIIAAISTVFFINQIKSKVIISDVSIVSFNLFSRKELEFKNISGFEINGRMIDIVPNDQKYRRLSVYDYVRDDDGESLMQWLEKNLTDLDQKKEKAI